MNANFDQKGLNEDATRLIGTASTRPLRHLLYLALLVGDVVCILIAFAVGALVRFGNLHGFGLEGVAVSITLLFGLCASFNGAYSIEALRSATTGIARALVALLMAFGLLLAITYFLKVDARFSRILTGTSFIVAAAALILTRKLFNEWVEHRFSGVLTTEIILCDGWAFDAPNTMQRFDARALGLRPDPRDSSMLFLLAGVVQGADRVVVACAPSAARNWSLMLKGTGIQGEILTSEFDLLGPTGVAKVAGRSTLVVASGPLNVRQRMAKRLFDLSVTIPALILLLPGLSLIALLVKLDSRGPVLFRQRRVGRGNALFYIYKFRTMATPQTDPDGARSAGRDDQRVTRVGRVLRRTSLDELPQLLNVLLGSMSIVGPRPHALRSLAGDELFWHIDESYWHRHVLKPGITGLAQIRGYRGATDTSDDLRSRLSSDLEYVSGWSLWRDLSIVVRTARVVVHDKAY